MPPISKNKIKYIQSLHRKKGRVQASVFLVEGEKMVAELLHRHKENVLEIFALEDWIEAHEQLLERFQRQIYKVSTAELKKISTFTTPNRVLVVARQFSASYQNSDITDNLSLYLDGIQDPGNMGTILRIADWFGIPYVFCSEHTVEVYNPKVVQASMGAIFRIKTIAKNLLELKKDCPNLPIYGTVLKGDDIFKTPLSSKGMIVIGNEGGGISEEIQAILTHRITIPSFATNGAESLNAGVATGIVCAMFRKSLR